MQIYIFKKLNLTFRKKEFYYNQYLKSENLYLILIIISKN